MLISGLLKLMFDLVIFLVLVSTCAMCSSVLDGMQLTFRYMLLSTLLLLISAMLSLRLVVWNVVV